MRQYLLDLYEIQKIDLGIREVEKKQDAIPTKLRELESSSQSLKSEIAKVTALRDAAINERKTMDGTVQAETHKIRKWEARLNDIRNQRESLALSREIDTAKRVNKEAEDKMAELTTTRTQYETQIAELEHKLAAVDSDCTAERERVENEITAVQTSVAGERERRISLLPKVPKQVLARYDAIRSKRLGIGLVMVTGGCCTGCNMRLPPQLYNILQRGETIEQCPSCFRLIFWDQILQRVDAKSGSDASA